MTQYPVNAQSGALEAQGRRPARKGAGHGKDNSNAVRIELTGRASASGREHAQDRLWRRMHTLRRVTQRAALRMCGAPLGASVQIQRSGDRATIVGAMRCGSPAVCPRCNAALSRRRVDVLAPAIEELQQSGCVVAMVALTIRHTARHSLRWGLNMILAAWSDMFAGRRLKAWRDIGLIGAVRTIEATHGSRNGWHPHIHALFICRAGTNLEHLRNALIWEWARRVPMDPAALYCEPVFNAQQAASYVSKGPANEVLLGQDKTSAPGRVHPFELLDVRSERARRLWQQWESAVRGRRFLGYIGKKAIECQLGRPLALPDDVEDEPIVHDYLDVSRGTWIDCLRWGMVAAVLRLVREGLDTSALAAYDSRRARCDIGCATSLHAAVMRC